MLFHEAFLFKSCLHLLHFVSRFIFCETVFGSACVVCDVINKYAVKTINAYTGWKCFQFVTLSSGASVLTIGFLLFLEANIVTSFSYILLDFFLFVLLCCFLLDDLEVSFQHISSSSFLAFLEEWLTYNFVLNIL